MAEVIGSVEVVLTSDPQPVEASLAQIQRTARETGDRIRRALDIRPRPVDVRIDVDTTTARREVEQFTRDAAGRLRDARGRFASESRALGDGVGAGLETATRGFLGLSRATFGAVQGLGELTTASPVAAAGLAVVGGSLAATAAATAGLGAAFAGLGVALLADVPKVKNAFTDLGQTLKAVGQAAAQPLQGPLLDALQRIQSAAIELGPDLQRVFREAQPFLDALVDGALDAAQNALPGIENALAGLEPVARAVQTVLGQLGTAIGETLEVLAQDPQGVALALESVGSIIATVLPLLGQLGSTVTTVVAPSLATLAGLLEAVAPALEVLIPILGSLYALVTFQFGTALDILTQSFTDTGASADVASEASKGFSAALAESVLSLQAQAAAQTEATAVQGVFANAVLAVNTYLAQQKADADSLKNSLFALTDVTRGAIDAQSAYEGAIDRARDALEKNGAVLDYQNGRLDLNSKKARDVYDALSAVARQTQDYTAKTLEATGSTDKARAVFEAGRKKLIALADAAGLSADEAKRLADEIVGIPPYKKVTIDVQQRVQAGPALNKPQVAANGRIVTQATNLIAGEAGPEVIIPLTRPQRAAELVEESGLFGVLARASRGVQSGGGGEPVPASSGRAAAQPPPVTYVTVMIDGREVDAAVETRLAQAARDGAQGIRR